MAKTKIIRIFISEASRNDAHNLDDLNIRWQIRHEQTRKYDNLQSIVQSLPQFKTDVEAQKFRLFLLQQNTYLVDAKNELKTDRLMLGRENYLKIQTQLTEIENKTKEMIRQINYGIMAWSSWKRDDFDDTQSRSLQNSQALIALTDFKIEYNNINYVMGERIYTISIDGKIIAHIELVLPLKK